MTKFTYSRILNFDDNPLWGINGLIDNEMHLELKKLFSARNVSGFQVTSPKNEKHDEYSQGIYSACRDEEDWVKMFNSDVIHKIATKIISLDFLELITNLFLKSQSQYKNSKFLLNYGIAADNNAIQRFEESRGFLLLKPYAPIREIQKDPNVIHDITRWSETYTKNQLLFREESKEYFSRENAIPFFPDMEFNVCQHGSHLAPHTDAKRHLATLMINIPLNEEQANSNLGTTYWDRKSKIRIKNDHGLGLLSREEVENNIIPNYRKIRTLFTPFVATLFFRSRTSWHSFEYDRENIGPRNTIKVHFICPYEFKN